MNQTRKLLAMKIVKRALAPWPRAGLVKLSTARKMLLTGAIYSRVKGYG